MPMPLPPRDIQYRTCSIEDERHLVGGAGTHAVVLGALSLDALV